MDVDGVPGTGSDEVAARRQPMQELPRSAATAIALEAASAPTTTTRKRGRPRRELAPSPPKKKRGRPQRVLPAQEMPVASAYSRFSDDDASAMAGRPTLTIPLKPQYGYLATNRRRKTTSPSADKPRQPSAGAQLIETALQEQPTERRYPARSRAAPLGVSALHTSPQSKKGRGRGRPPRKQAGPEATPTAEIDDAQASLAEPPRDEPSSTSYADASRLAALEKRLRDLDRYNAYLESRITELEAQVAAATRGQIERPSARDMAMPQPASATYVPPSGAALVPAFPSVQFASTPIASAEPARATSIRPASGVPPPALRTTLGVPGSHLMPANLLPWLSLPPTMYVSADFLMEATANLIKPWSVAMGILPQATRQARLEALPRMLTFVVDGKSFDLPTSTLLEHEASYFHTVVLHQPYAIDKTGAAVFALQVHLSPALFGRITKYLLYKHLDTRDLSATNMTLLHCTLKFWCIKWFERSPTLFTFDGTLSSAKIALLNNNKAASLLYENDLDFEWAYGANAVTRFSVVLGDIGGRVLVGLGPREPSLEPGNFAGWFIHVQAFQKAYLVHTTKAFDYMEQRPVTFERGDLLTVLLDRDTLWLRFFRNQMELDVAFRLEPRHVRQPLFPSIGLRPSIDVLRVQHGCHVTFYG
ncbi:hypothetical protein SDRG_02091 [Saprolegnia diclina VS20]|uniref:Uncharacterized protein n=1 Tax=Saprolegnia diclina (strain VS20) TaxID=1156394 RepID=T0QSC9_SAPDV|nr:hypothetical protein SDRG_02091 [Saprolegnia diclina VS20]EQC41034.1 hypothetical protein SDRG_02091 [Saprolegnia diclina VS20]|eukprot:XP_008605878.1 hypothetical protein SDRG_02091 [Saprolegnia diclina VS20]